jgi:hypothetical protein
MKAAGRNRASQTVGQSKTDSKEGREGACWSSTGLISNSIAPTREATVYFLILQTRMRHPSEESMDQDSENDRLFKEKKIATRKVGTRQDSEVDSGPEAS